MKKKYSQYSNYDSMHVIVEGSLFMLFFFVIDLVILASYINVMNMPVGYFHVQNFDYAY